MSGKGRAGYGCNHSQDPKSQAGSNRHCHCSKPSQSKVLVVGQADGYIQVFGDKKIINAKFVIQPFINSPEGEVLAEEFVSCTIPRPYREIYYPGKVLVSGTITTRTPTQMAEQYEMRKLYRYLDTLASKERQVTRWS